MTVQDPTVSAILARLDTLERQNARLKTVGATIVLLALSVTLLVGQAHTAKVLEANEFVLRDASGKIRGRLGIGVTGLRLPPNAPAPSDLVSLELYDSAGKPMARLMAGPDHGVFSLGPSSPGMPAIAMEVNNKGALQEFGATVLGTRRTMALNADSTGTAIVLDSSGGEKHGISLTDGDPLKSPSVVVFDSAGFESQLGVTTTTVTATGQQRKTSAASLIFLDKNANVLWTAP